MKLMAMSVVENPVESNSLIVTGGHDTDSGETYNNSILKFTCLDFENCSWTILSQKLKIARQHHVSFMIYGQFNCTQIK